MDGAELAGAARAAASQPSAVVGALGLYALAFIIRAAVWRRVLPDLALGQALAALHVSLAGNHVLPLRLGEPLRITSVVRRAGISLEAATASTLALRSADVLALAGLTALLAPRLVADVAGAWAWAALASAAVIGALGIAWLARLRASAGGRIRLPGLAAAVGAVAAWVLESAVMWQAGGWAGVALSPLDAIFVTALTVGAQAFAVTPGGVGTYEAAATAALVGLGARPGAALAAAVTAHALKTGYALVAGGVGLFAPSPGLLGRLRLPRRPNRPWAPEPAPAGPVVLFLPAHNEQDAVGAVVSRVPAAVCGRQVRCLVIDDGSTDRTAEVARTAGARVVALGHNQGLGAAVRRGLQEAVEAGAAAVAFCDADGEYAPEELERLIAPVLEGRAEYVVGSRFAGDIRRMLPHRRLGNITLTAILRFVARARITDGQSGYRAFSAAAARDAEIIHDFNYAQVLTLDLLAKGYRYAEVPIGYGFRTTGRSFVRLGRYLRAVIPAIHHQINAEPAPRQAAV